MRPRRGPRAGRSPTRRRAGSGCFCRVHTRLLLGGGAAFICRLHLPGPGWWRLWLRIMPSQGLGELRAGHRTTCPQVFTGPQSRWPASGVAVSVQPVPRRQTSWWRWRGSAGSAVSRPASPVSCPGFAGAGHGQDHASSAWNCHSGNIFDILPMVRKVARITTISRRPAEADHLRRGHELHGAALSNMVSRCNSCGGHVDDERGHGPVATLASSIGLQDARKFAWIFAG